MQSKLMKQSAAILLLVLGFLSAVIAARHVASPGYMDADYYYSMGIQWANGKGNEEPFLWNYLNDPTEIPTPSHAYWSPLTSIISGIALRISGVGFRSAQLPFILFTALLPFFVWRLALKLNIGQQAALLAGTLATTPGFFLPFFVTTDVFSLYALLGALLMLTLLMTPGRRTPTLWVMIGVICGLAHLSRADGFLFLVFPMGLILSRSTIRLRSIGLLILGYLVVMAPWFYRNLLFLGSPLASGAGRTLWLLTYDEIFSYPASEINFVRWWASGLDQILLQRWSAVKVITQRIVAENGLVFLIPFMMIGIVKNWRVALVRSTVYYLGLLFVVMAFVFPMAGARGGWFHSSVAAMPLLWVMAANGLSVAVKWVGERRTWKIARAKNVFGITVVVFSMIFTWGLFLYRVVGVKSNDEHWNNSTAQYRELHQTILERDAMPGLIALNNPPGFFHVSSMQAVVIPDGDIRTLKQVVDEFGVSWVILDQNHPEGLESLFSLVDIPEWLLFEASLTSYGDSFVLFRVNGA
jgi:hypothetical protein